MARSSRPEVKHAEESNSEQHNKKAVLLKSPSPSLLTSDSSTDVFLAEPDDFEIEKSLDNLVELSTEVESTSSFPWSSYSVSPKLKLTEESNSEQHNKEAVLPKYSSPPLPTFDSSTAVFLDESDDFEIDESLKFSELDISGVESRSSSPWSSNSDYPMDDPHKIKYDDFSDTEDLDEDQEMIVEFGASLPTMDNVAITNTVTPAPVRKRKLSEGTSSIISCTPSVSSDKYLKTTNKIELPPELKDPAYLDTQSLGRTTQVCTQWFHFYKVPLRARRLLSLVMQADYENVTKMLASADISPSLFEKPTLENISSVQYAAKTLDITMLRLFIQDIQHELELINCFLEQVKEQPTLDLAPFFAGAEELIRKYNQEGITDETLLQLGRLQSLLPNHMLGKVWPTIIRERGMRSFSPAAISPLLGKECALVHGSDSPKVASLVVEPGTQHWQASITKIVHDLTVLKQIYQSALKQYDDMMRALHKAVQTNDKPKLIFAKTSV